MMPCWTSWFRTGTANDVFSDFGIPHAHLGANCLLAAALLTIVSIGVSSIVSLQIRIQCRVNQKIVEKLEAVVDGRRNQLETFLANLQQDLTATSQNNLMRIALESFKYDWGFLGADVTTELKRRYITENPFPQGQRPELRHGAEARCGKDQFL